MLLFLVHIQCGLSLNVGEINLYIQIVLKMALLHRNMERLGWQGEEREIQVCPRLRVGGGEAAFLSKITGTQNKSVVLVHMSCDTFYMTFENMYLTH